MAKVSASVMAAKAKKVATRTLAGKKALGIVGKIEQLNADAQDLRAAADGIRKDYPPEIAAFFEEVKSILRKADGYVLALGTNYGEVDHPVELPSPMLTQKLHRAGRFIWDKDDMIPDWILRDIREQTQNTLRAWRNLSKAVYPALSTATGVVNGAIAVYDAATWTVDSTQQLLTEKTPKEAAGAICRDFVAHSGYRRYKLSRVPGKHAAWNEVCDFWAENDTAPFGESFTWPRPEDPMYRGLPPTAMRAGKSVVEAGCLPGENCRNDSYRYRYHIDEYGLRDTINPVLGFPTNIQNVIDGREMDNLFDLATEVLDEAIKLLILLRQRLRSVRNELNRPLVKTALLVLPELFSWVGVAWETMREWESTDDYSDMSHAAAEAVAERWDPVEAYEAAVDGLSDAYNKLGEAKDDANGYWAEIPTYALMWRGGDFADAWRERIAPHLEMAVERAADISTLINGVVWQNACDSLYPKGPGTWEARERYWETQGVPSRCGAPVGSYMPTVTPRFDPPTGRQGGQFTPGGGKVLEAVSLGAIATDHPGVKSWQKVALVGGLIWLITREK
jgi:hypothetical protein